MNSSNIQSGAQIVSGSDVLSSGIVTSGHLTPDGLMLYMQTRLGGLDDQVNAAFDKQKKIESLRKVLGDLSTALSKYDPDAEGDEHNIAEAQGQIDQALIGMHAIDPGGAKTLAAELDRQGIPVPYAELGLLDSEQMPPAGSAADRQHGNGDRIIISDGELTAVKEAISQNLKELESSAQLEMIQLQSVMSARQTAISLCTNLVASIGKGSEAIVGNIGR